jgi:hypothetical protein
MSVVVEETIGVYVYAKGSDPLADLERALARIVCLRGEVRPLLPVGMEFDGSLWVDAQRYARRKLKRRARRARINRRGWA